MSRAERYAALQAGRVAPGLEELGVDLKALAGEGDTWSSEHAGPKARHAALWREIMATHNAKCAKPPKFRWSPSHLDGAQAISKGFRGRRGRGTDGPISSRRKAPRVYRWTGRRVGG